jgi:two-component system response regulator RegX3
MKQKLRILVVEDETAIRSGLMDVLVYHGYDVDGAAEGRDGLAKVSERKYDLVILDVMLPGVSGFDICDAIRKRDRDQPIIMLTAKVADEDIVRGLSLGADDYVAKPFSIAALVLRSKRCYVRSRAVVELGGAHPSRRHRDRHAQSVGASRYARHRVHAPRDGGVAVSAR